LDHVHFITQRKSAEKDDTDTDRQRSLLLIWNALALLNVTERSSASVQTARDTVPRLQHPQGTSKILYLVIFGFILNTGFCDA